MKNKNILFTVSYWVIGLILFVVAYLLFAFGTLNIYISSFTDQTLFRTTVEINASIPGEIYLLGGNLVSSIGLKINNAIGISLSQTVNNISFEGFKIDLITCSILVGSLLVFIVDAIFKKFKIVNYVSGGLISLCGIALFFEPVFFGYFNKDIFKKLYQYLDGIDISGSNINNNIKINYSNPCVMIGASIILITGILIVGYQIYKSIKENKNTSIENEETINQN